MKFLTTRQVAGILGVSERTVLRLVKAGDLKAESDTGYQKLFAPAKVHRFHETYIPKPRGRPPKPI